MTTRSDPVVEALDVDLKSPPSGMVVEAMRSWIESGRLREGDALPSEREVARRLDVARTTVRSAFDELSRLGLVEAAGDRRRRVIRSATAQTSVLSKTVGVFTQLGRFARQFPDMPRGWDLYTYQRCVQVLQERGCHALLMSPQTLGRDDLTQVVAGRPMGMLLTHEVQPELRGRLIAVCRAYRVPLVADGDDPDLEQVDRAYSDQFAGGRLLGRWMIERGRRRVLCLWPRLQPMHGWLRQRRLGYEQAMREAGLTPLALANYPLLPVAHTRDHDQEAVFRENVRIIAGHLLEHLGGDRAIDGILALTDAEAYQVAAALRLAGRSSGRDVLVAGYDNTWPIEMERGFAGVEIDASIDKCNDDVGTALAELLMERPEPAERPRPRVRPVAPRLVVCSKE